MRYDVEALASNSHADLEHQISDWLKIERPQQIIKCQFVADGAEFTYCVLFIFVPSIKPLPDRKKFKTKLKSFFLSCFGW